ncbi:beta-scruin-like [Babylonia areolata]|uniref:beta-scruin-like n=1 Tax=Babylonia areolata TaxID=304850 RepID=UPI003FD5C46F
MRVNRGLTVTFKTHSDRSPGSTQPPSRQSELNVRLSSSMSRTGTSQTGEMSSARQSLSSKISTPQVRTTSGSSPEPEQQQLSPTSREDETTSPREVPFFRVCKSHFNDDDVEGKVTEVTVGFKMAQPSPEGPPKDSPKSPQDQSNRRKRSRSRSGDSLSASGGSADSGDRERRTAAGEVDGSGGGDVLAIGGYVEDDSEEGCSYSHKLDMDQMAWDSVSQMPKTRLNFAAAFLTGKLYVTGGFDPQSSGRKGRATKSTYRYDPNSERWDRASEMHCARAFHTVCVVGGRLYAIGGQDEEEEVLNTAEVYSPKKNVWEPVSSMSECRVGACSAPLNGRVAVVGGYGSDSPEGPCPVLLSTEWFDPASKKWQPGSNLRVPRAQGNLVAVGSKLYLLGGVTRNVCTGLLCSMRDVDRYDPSTQQWTHVTDLQISRHNAGAAALGTKVYVVGGVSTDVEEPLRSTECLDTNTNLWDPSVPLLPYGAKSFACVVTS